MENNHRLTIITDTEIENLFGLPNFSQEQRTWYFSLSAQELEILETFRTINTKIYFILQLGYFKAKGMFFSFSFSDVNKDVRYIMNTYFTKQKSPRKAVSTKSQSKCKNCILKILGSRDFRSLTKRQLETKLSQITKRGIKPEFVFRELLLYLENSCISIPAYNTLRDIVGFSIEREEHRLFDILRDQMSTEVKESLKKLLDKDDALYTITIIKKKPKDFRFKEITEELNKYKELKDLYKFTDQIFRQLKISKQNIQYYASMADHYNIYKLRRMQMDRASLYLLCFIHHRFQQINDNLIACMIYFVDKYKQENDEFVKDKIVEHKLEANLYLKKVAHILDLFIDESIPTSATFEYVKEKAFTIIEEDKLHLLKQYLLN